MLENNYYSQIFFANNNCYRINKGLFLVCWITIIYFLDLLAHHLSKIKYQMELAIGSTIASVKATEKDTSATSIKTVIAIAK